MLKLFDYFKNNITYIIAEMSGNHSGNFDKCVEIIKAASESGADCLKIQTYTADTITIDCHNDEFKLNGGLWDGKYLYDLYNIGYTPWEWTNDIKKITEENGMDFLSTPFDFTAVDFLEKIGLEFYKVASMEINDIPLIKKIAITNKPVIMSCGMASIDEINEAVETFRKYSDKEIVLLKCCSAYPSKYDDMNISTISDMIKRFNTYVGLSDHSGGSIASIAAVTSGACVIEKHICLDKHDNTIDSGFSLDKNEFKQLVSDIRNAEKAIGKPTYGPSVDEMNSYKIRRSLYAVKDIKKGEKFTSDNIRSIRPSNGLHTRYYDFLIENCHAATDIKFGTPLSNVLIAENI